MLYTFLPLMDSGIKGKSFFVCVGLLILLYYFLSPQALTFLEAAVNRRHSTYQDTCINLLSNYGREMYFTEKASPLL